MFWKKRRIYLDYASAPPVSRAAADVMREAEQFVGNPGAIHDDGVRASEKLEESRTRIAACLGCKSREIVFTSGLSEANNLAILGYARTRERRGESVKGTHWIVSSIEHASVLECFMEIERLGGSVTHVAPDERGVITAEAVSRVLKPETVFVSIGWANNEIGTVQPLAEISRVIRDHEKQNNSLVVLHADAGQAPLYRATTLNSLGVDLLSIGANKLHGPHGIGALYIDNRLARPGGALAPVILGGRQERNMRAGTENVALAAGFAAAFEESVALRRGESDRLERLRDEFAHILAQTIPGIVVNGSLRAALPHMLNVSIPNVKSEYVTLALSQEGISISTKSACREGEESRSYVVEELGGEQWRSENTFRFSLGRDTVQRDLKKTAMCLAAILKTHQKQHR